MTRLLAALLAFAALPAHADMARDVTGAMHWYVRAACADGHGRCTFMPPDRALPTREACFAYGRKIQLERRLPMNDFRCEVKP